MLLDFSFDLHMHYQLPLPIFLNILNYHSNLSLYLSIYLSIIAADPGAGIGLVYLCGGKLGELSETL